MKVSLIIPVFNEANHLRPFYDSLIKVKLPCDVQYVIVDDRSTDSSWEITQAFIRDHADLDVISFRQEHNQGKGAALHKGIELATGQIIAIQDADFEYDPSDLPKLLTPILDKKCDVVFGSRFHRSGHQVHRTFHYLVNRSLTILSNLMSGLYLTDMETCYKVFKSEIIKSIHLESKRFGFEPEVTAAVAKLKIRVAEFPISYFPRNYIEGKKISWKDGVAAIWFILKFNLRRPKQLIKETMPTHYIPQGKQWL